MFYKHYYYCIGWPCSRSVPRRRLKHSPSLDGVCGSWRGNGVPLPLPRGHQDDRRPLCTDVQGSWNQVRGYICLLFISHVFWVCGHGFRSDNCLKTYCLSPEGSPPMSSMHVHHRSTILIQIPYRLFELYVHHVTAVNIPPKMAASSVISVKRCRWTVCGCKYIAN